MSRRLLLSVTYFAVALLLAVEAQDSAAQITVDPSAMCKQDILDTMTNCLGQVEKDESKLASGPCSSEDWKCICTKQQGMFQCYTNCPGMMPVDMVNFNNGNCKGQHQGISMKGVGGDLTYTWSTLPVSDTGAQQPEVAPQVVSPGAINSTGDAGTKSPLTQSNSTTTTKSIPGVSSNSTSLNTTANTTPTSSKPTTSSSNSNNGVSLYAGVCAAFVFGLGSVALTML